MIDGAEPHSLKSVLPEPVVEPFDNLWIEWSDQAVCDKQFWIGFQAVGDIRIVPAEKTRIDQHRIAQSEVAHLFHLVFDRRRYFHFEIWTGLRMIERKSRIERPDFQVGVDDQPWPRRRRPGRTRGSGPCRAGQHLATIDASVLFEMGLERSRDVRLRNGISHSSFVHARIVTLP